MKEGRRLETTEGWMDRQMEKRKEGRKEQLQISLSPSPTLQETPLAQFIQEGDAVRSWSHPCFHPYFLLRSVFTPDDTHVFFQETATSTGDCGDSLSSFMAAVHGPT